MVLGREERATVRKHGHILRKKTHTKTAVKWKQRWQYPDGTKQMRWLHPLLLEARGSWQTTPDCQMTFSKPVERNTTKAKSLGWTRCLRSKKKVLGQKPQVLCLTSLRKTLGDFLPNGKLLPFLKSQVIWYEILSDRCLQKHSWDEYGTNACMITRYVIVTIVTWLNLAELWEAFALSMHRLWKASNKRGTGLGWEGGGVGGSLRKTCQMQKSCS